ncbi:MAG: rod shape-determining protein RodA [Desulfobacteraceae bacterium]|nr:rod shape-determining protein RodA [Desulfobacteraceae bacterium]
MFDRRLVQCFDWSLLGLTLLISGVGLLTLYSAVTADTGTLQKTLFTRQLIWFGLGLGVMIFTFLLSFKLLEHWANFIYVGGIGLLLCVMLFGKYVGGSKRWLALGPISIQPSEIIKIVVILVLARYFSRLVTTRGFSLKELFTPFVLTMIPFILIVRQPDLGTALLVALIAGSMTLFVKIERRSIGYLILNAALAIPLVWFFFLKGYQKQRILTFLNPDRDPLGAGYHIIQSKIAIGSGMLTGKGYLKGTQNALSFLPEQHTDFIFSVFAEEWGLLGTIMVLLIYLMIITWGLNIAHRSRDPFGTIMSVGVTAMIFWQVFINIGMVMGLMPVVGVPLPFISYGGSSAITMMTGIGILMNVSMRRFLFE